MKALLVLCLALSGCAAWRAPSPVQRAAAQSPDGRAAWFVMRSPEGHDEIWFCSADASKLCRRFGP